MKGEQGSAGFTLEDLYYAYMPAVYDMAFFFLPNSSDAENVVRDCFVSLARCESCFRDRRQILGWLILAAAVYSRKWSANATSPGFTSLLHALHFLRDREGFTLAELAALLRIFWYKGLSD